ncbi:hypothetical protein GCM10009678_49750 [Actinomadura kijaniata]
MVSARLRASAIPGVVSASAPPAIRVVAPHAAALKGLDMPVVPPYKIIREMIYPGAPDHTRKFCVNPASGGTYVVGCRECVPTRDARRY